MDNKRSLKSVLQLRVLARGVFWLLPKAVRFYLYRLLVKIPKDSAGDLVFEVARTQDDLEAAFSILHDEYVRMGWMDPTPSRLRVTPYHALPSTAVLVAKKKGEVIATVSIIREGAFGFPLEKVFSLSHLQKNGVRIAEISSLAIKRGHRENRGQVLFALLKFLYEFCTQCFGVDYIVFAVHPRSFDFYEAIMLATELSRLKVSYEFVKGAPAKGGYIGFRDAYMRWGIEYSKLPKSKNLFKFFTETKDPRMKLPIRSEYLSISTPVFSPAMLHYFFSVKTTLFSEFNPVQLGILRSLYRTEAYCNVIPEGDPRKSTERREVRFDVKCAGRLLFSKAPAIEIQVKNVSQSGFLALANSRFDLGRELKGQIAIGDFKIAVVRCFAVRKDNDLYGFVVSKSDQDWNSFIAYLEAELQTTQSAA